MPYKHIAVHLKKTELACRLHYHQLSFGNKHRRRAASVSSTASSKWPSSSPLNRSVQGTPQRQLPPFTLPSTPEDNGGSMDGQSSSSQSHVPILPKPIQSSQRAVQPTHALRLVTEDIKQFKERQVIDMARLNRVYDAHRVSFWSMIAQNYGCNLSPATLEEAWRRSQGASQFHLPPTPCTSPQSTPSSAPSAAFSSALQYGKGFTPVNTPQNVIATPSTVKRGTFAISSLLTENKEVRSPGYEKKFHECQLR